MKKQLYVISHTHWDREWYQTFQEYRIRLVRMMDDLLDVLESTSFPVFHLDGQTIVLEDYLEIRPYNRKRLEKLIEDGRILIGPWYVMPDEFLVSGESLVRNLQLGHKICKDWNTKPMNCGYVTDIFGHNSQFPQILRGFGIDNALLYRGIADYPKDAFTWQGADGSEITAFKMDPVRSYSNFHFAVRWPMEEREMDLEEMTQRMKILYDHMAPQCNTDVMLLMDGVDHMDIEPRIPEILRYMEERIPNVHFVHGSMEDYREAYLKQEPKLDTISGPLYHPGKFGVNNQVLKNVLSSMVFLKQSNACCETLLTRWAEPMDLAATMLNLPKSDKVRSMEPRRDFHDYAWKTLIQNHPHDSICGCSIGDVHRDNIYRFRQAQTVAERSIDDSLRTICDQIDLSQGKGRDGAVVLFQQGDQNFDGVAVFELKLSDGEQKSFRFYDSQGSLIPHQVLSSRKYHETAAELRELVRHYSGQIHTIAMPVHIPAHGYASYSFDNCKIEWADYSQREYTYARFEAPNRCEGTMRICADTFDNGVLLVKVNPNGTLSVTDKKTGHVYTNLLRMEDSGDKGDGWTFRKPDMDATDLGLGGNCDIILEADGPLAAQLKIVKRLLTPNTLDALNHDKRSEETSPLILTTTVRILKDSCRIDVKTQLHNDHDNHRLRVNFDTNLAGAQTFYTKTPYDMQPWSVEKEDCHDFVEKDTRENPSQGITYIQDGENAFALYSKGLYEVECRDDAARSLALTLLRATDDAAGFPEGRDIMRRDFSLEYAMDFAPATAAEAMAAGESWKAGLLSCTRKKQPGLLPETLSFFRTEGNGNTIVTAAVCDGNGTVVRLLNAGETEDNGALMLCRPVKEAYSVDLLGNRLSSLPCTGSAISYSLPPKKLVTIELSME